MNHKNLLSILSLTIATSAVAHSESVAIASLSTGQPLRLSPVVITASPGEKPLETTIDARAAAQPIPAQDGADYLKSVPGFSVIRKGGIDGDPVLRGQAGSRLNILLDGQNIFGGCGYRMDPPTAYVFPSAFDRVTVLKGPQSVLYGPGSSAGVVLFERDTIHYAQPGATLEASGTMGSFDRKDVAVDIRAGAPSVYAQAAASRSSQDDYADGNGGRIHSRYERWSGSAAVGWTPGENTVVELSAALSDGEAAYADRMMDGAKFERENIGFRFETKTLSSTVEKLSVQAYYNYVDHVMDNYSLRPFMPSMMMPGRSASNPDRKTIGGRVNGTLNLADTKITAGFDAQSNRHAARGTSDELTDRYERKTRVRDAAFDTEGVFAEMSRIFGGNKMIVGTRVDTWKVVDSRATASAGMSVVANPTANEIRRKTLHNEFARAERTLKVFPATIYLGIGHAERFPDYWELFSKESTESVSSFGTKPERTTQVDWGALYKKGTLSLSVSGFSNKVNDYILVQSNWVKPAGMMGTRQATVARNVDTSSWGGEVALAWTVAEHWRIDGGLSFVRGKNITDARPLAQQPPLEGRIGVTYTAEKWSVGALARVVAEQNRFSLNQGNIVGQDLGPTGGFSIFSLNSSWRVAHFALLSVGVDNIFNKAYAEFISRGGTDVAGYVSTVRVNEPGRTLWAKLNLKY